MFTTGIFKAWLSMGDAVAAAQLSTCLLGFVVVVLALERASRSRAAYHGDARVATLRPQRLRGARAARSRFAACAAPVAARLRCCRRWFCCSAWPGQERAAARRALAALVAQQLRARGADRG